jgi:hypothetical protein
MGLAKFYKLTTTIAPAPEVRALIDKLRRRELKTGCGYAVPYVPIVPGEYTFLEEHSEGAKVSVGIDRPSLTVPADRKHLELRFTVGGHQQRAVYKVRRAHFVGD